MTIKYFISAIAIAAAALPAVAQTTFSIADSTGGHQVAAKSIDQADIYNRINTAQGAANTAQGTANDAQWRATNAQDTANWAQSAAITADGHARTTYEMTKATWLNVCYVQNGFGNPYCQSLANAQFPGL